MSDPTTPATPTGPQHQATGRELVDGWRSRGRLLETDVGRIFCVDVPGPDELPPALVLHGFPSNSFDWHRVVDHLASERRVVLFDFLGYGLSAKPDRPYSMRLQADVAARVAAAHGLERVVLVSHDMGDTVGGELLARDLEGILGFEVVARLVTNGSIYIEMAQLTAGQQLLLSLPDERLPDGLVSADGYCNGLAETCAAAHRPSAAELEAHWLLQSHEAGHRLLPRLIRYVEERRREERRFTGAIESHPAPLGVLWGTDDPVAVIGMVDVLHAARPDATVVRLEGIGHYPMMEAPELFAAEAAALLRALAR